MPTISAYFGFWMCGMLALAAPIATKTTGDSGPPAWRGKAGITHEIFDKILPADLPALAGVATPASFGLKKPAGLPLRKEVYFFCSAPPGICSASFHRPFSIPIDFSKFADLSKPIGAAPGAELAFFGDNTGATTIPSVSFPNAASDLREEASSFDLHLSSHGQPNEPPAERSPLADSRHLENKARGQATRPALAVPDPRSSVPLLFSCAVLLALILAACRGQQRGRQLKKMRAAGSVHLRTRALRFKTLGSVFISILQGACGTPPLFPPPPFPPLPPLAPGFVAAASENELYSLIEAAAADVSVYLPPSAHFMLSDQIKCNSSIKVTVTSSGEGATLDGQRRVGLFYLTGRCSLTLRGLTLVNGRARNGGIVYANGAGDIEIIESAVRGCAAALVCCA